MGSLGSLGLLYPAALYFLALVPALVVPYLARERPRQAVVSSVLAFRALRAHRGERFGGWPRFDWTFFVELLILCLAVLAMARPYVIHQGSPVAAVLDNSAAMQALTPSGKTRFETAVAQLKSALEREAGNVTLYLTAPQPHQLPGVFTTSGEAVAALEQVRVTDAPDDSSALTTLLAQLNADRRLGRIIFASYRSVAAPVPPRVTALTVGVPIANYAIGSFTLSRQTIGAAALHARLAVANFSPTAQVLKATITGDGKVVGHAESRVDPGEVAGIEFPNLPAAETYRAQLEPTDGFMLDNVAYATGSAVKSVSILFVSPVPSDGESLKSIPGLAVTARTPNTYSPKDLAQSDLAIFEYTTPKELPTVNALLVMPPPGDPVFGFGVRPAPRISITEWPSTSPLTDGVNFRLLNVRSGEYFDQHPWMQSEVSGVNGGLMLTGQRQGHRFAATGFNLFPYLGKQNLPMSVLTLNLLSNLADVGAHGAGFRTGEPWLMPSGVKQVVLPSGGKISVQPGMLFTQVLSQGVYQLIEATGIKAPRAVNLADLGASDLENVPPVKLEAVASAAPEPANVTVPLTGDILALIIALIVIEAILIYRRRRLTFELQP